MYKYDDFYNSISLHQLSFHWEDPYEIHYLSTVAKENIKSKIKTIYENNQMNFVISFEDENLSIPAEIEFIDTLINASLVDKIKIKFKFKKSEIFKSNQLENIVLYHSLNNLVHHMDGLNFSEFKSFIFKDKEYCKVFVFDSEIYLSNKFITITNKSVGNKTDNDFKFNSTDNYVTEITPKHLYFDTEEKSNIIDIFNKWCGYLCLTNLSSNSIEADEEDSFIFQFNGQKKVSLKTTIDKDKMHNIETLFHFYEWTYNEKTEDKIKIFHNLLPLHINLKTPIDIEEFLLALPELVEATKENFNFYIHENIKTYLDERKKIEDMVMQTSSLISIELNKITDLLIRTLTGVFLSIISAIIIISIRSQMYSIVSYGLYLFAFIMIVSFLIIAYFTFSSVRISYDNFNDRINEYSRLLTPSRITEIRKPVKKRRRLYFTMLTITFLLLIMFTTLIVALGMYLLNGSNFLINNLIDLINIIT